MSMRVYFLNQDLGGKHTGIESSALLRSSLFINKLNIYPTFITCKYRCQLGTEIQELQRKNKLSGDIQVVNLYDFLQQLKDTQQTKLTLYSGDVIIPLVGEGYRKYLDVNNQVKVNAVYNNTNSRLHYVVHFHQGKKWRRDYYHEGGGLSCSQLLDSDGKAILQEVFYRTDHTICLIKNYMREAGRERPLVRIQVIDNNGCISEVLDAEADFIEYFLKIFFAEKNEISILLIDKNRFFYEPALKIREYYGKHRIKVIAAVHNLHAVNYHKKETSRININYTSIFADLSKPDAVIVQTDIQKRDIVERFGDTRNVYAIPHTYENQLQLEIEVVRNPFKAVFFARYNLDKKHDLAIQAFATVVKRIPEAELHCYGTGTCKAELIKLVSKFKMERNIYLHGWCDNVAIEYESVALSMLSSPSESFSLTIVESLAHGCPVVAFDVPYGPKELIHSGETGYLVPYANTMEMADKIVNIMLDKSLQYRLSENARVSAKQFSESVVVKKWRQVLMDISEK